MPIYKYPLQSNFGKQDVKLPYTFTILSVAYVNDVAVVYADIVDNGPFRTVEFEICATGDEAPPNGKFLGTLVTDSGIVLHVFVL